jgi:hypothetical protein
MGLTLRHQYITLQKPRNRAVGIDPVHKVLINKALLETQKTL